MARVTMQDLVKRGMAQEIYCWDKIRSQAEKECREFRQVAGSLADFFIYIPPKREKKAIGSRIVWKDRAIKLLNFDGSAILTRYVDVASYARVCVELCVNGGKPSTHASLKQALKTINLDFKALL
ncbi:MAG: hypothetical protein WC641_08445 [Patescibacteria group bacterium]